MKRQINQMAVKSTRASARKSNQDIAIKSTNLALGEIALVCRNMWQFYDSDESCYIINTKLEGNLRHYLNHSCSPILFIKNIFVDTNDLQFPSCLLCEQEELSQHKTDVGLQL
ncbi:hypothetical protein lerEdw1_018552 [Lerista edwardsae]|nr:hypothetical protein lerEdw1_018552 [Lerista edwardsae]